MATKRPLTKEYIRNLMVPWSRVLQGLACRDRGEKREGCDCCYCDPRKEPNGD